MQLDGQKYLLAEEPAERALAAEKRYAMVE